VATHGAVPVLTAVQVRFRSAPEVTPETPAGEAALSTLHLHVIVFWDERHRKVRTDGTGRRAELAGGKVMLKHKRF
jgi:hypothetical protein